MKRYNLYINEDAPELSHLEDATHGQWVEYEEAAEYAKSAMNTAVEASKLVIENELLRRRVEEQEETLEDQGQIIKASLETIEELVKANKELADRIMDTEAVVLAASKLAKAKGRFQTEQNFLALDSAVKELEGK